MPDSLVRHIFEPLWDVYEGSVRLQTLRELERTQWLSADELQAAANHKLGQMCRHAVATSPFYRRRFAAAGIDPAAVRSIEDLASLPLLTKDDVRGYLPEILSSSYQREDLVPAKTGGSTGVALQIYCDVPGVQWRNAAALRSDLWSGWQLGQPVAAVWGNPPQAVTLKNRLRSFLKERYIYLDTMRVEEQAIADFLVEWQRIRPGLLYGHAHSIFILCEALQQKGLTLDPQGIIATSMMLIESERRVIEAVCGTKVTNRYGCEEVSLIACECERHDGLHLNLDGNQVEFLRADGTACAPGEDGRIVVTELVNRGMPMIRYEVGDRGVPSARSCACGRGLPLMEQVTGRVADFLVATDGHRVAGISIIENTLTRMPGIQQMQVVQEEVLRLTVNLVPGTEYGPETESQLVAALQGYLGATVEVQVLHVERIPQEESGKYRFTICRI